MSLKVSKSTPSLPAGLPALRSASAFSIARATRKMSEVGYATMAKPTSLIFRVARAIENALADLKHGRPTGENDGVDFETFKDITSFADWAEVEQRAATLRK